MKDLSISNGDGLPVASDLKKPVGINYIAGFDGIRAIAVGMVLVAHAGYGNIVPGGFGVTIFFAVSGYLITTLLLRELSETGTIDLKLFYARRFLRLYPELLAMIASCLLVGQLLGLTATWTEKLAGVFYYMNYYYVFGQHYNVEETYPWRQLWSLSIEEHFYFFFPVLIGFTLRDKKSKFWLVVALIILPFLWRFITYYLIGLVWQYNYVATDTRIDSIAWGCLLALLMNQVRAAQIAGLPVFINMWAALLGLALLIGSLLYRNEDFRWTWRFSIQGLGIILVLGNILFDPRWKAIVRVLEIPAVRYVGRISYGLYLYHMLVNRVLEQFGPRMSTPVFLIVSTALSLAVASLSYLLLETPLKPLRRRLGSHVR